MKKKKKHGAFGKAGRKSSKQDQIADLIKKTMHGYWSMVLIGDEAAGADLLLMARTGCTKLGLRIEMQWRGRLLDFVVRFPSGEPWFSMTLEEANENRPPGVMSSIRRSVSTGIPSEEEQGLN